MADGYTIEITGIDEIISKFQQGDQVADKLLTNAMSQAVDLVGKDAGIYPPETASNQPPPPYYIRGQGTQYATFNMGESKDLRNQWEKTVEKVDEGVIGTVENKVSYAPWVHGIQSQAWFHTRNNWRKVDQIATDTESRIVEYFEIAAQQWANFMRS